MEFCTLASGSSGNCALLCHNRTVLLLDAGISARRIIAGIRALGRRPEELTGILLTHAHSDHTSGLRILAGKYPGLPVYGPEACIFDLWNRAPGADFHYFTPGDCFQLGEIRIETVETPHDTPVSVGYAFSANGRRIVTVTDLGWVPEPVAAFLEGADLLMVESNHDVDMLRNGRYPVSLKQRVLSDRGHLSNEGCAAAVCRAVRSGTKQVVLAHLSQENNLPELAYDATAQALEEQGYLPGRDVSLAVAPRTEPGEVLYL